MPLIEPRQKLLISHSPFKNYIVPMLSQLTYYCNPNRSPHINWSITEPEQGKYQQMSVVRH